MQYRNSRCIFIYKATIIIHHKWSISPFNVNDVHYRKIHLRSTVHLLVWKFQKMARNYIHRQSGFLIVARDYSARCIALILTWTVSRRIPTSFRDAGRLPCFSCPRAWLRCRWPWWLLYSDAAYRALAVRASSIWREWHRPLPVMLSFERGGLIWWDDEALTLSFLARRKAK